MNINWVQCPLNERYLISDDGQLKNKSSGKLLKIRITIHGYISYGFYVNGKRKDVRAHKIVALAFIPNKKNYSDINHINGDKSDNRVSNLEWCTRSQNLKHAFEKGLAKISEHQRQTARRNLTGNINRRKQVLNMDTGIVYPSLTSASIFLGIKISTLSAMLTGQNKSKFNIKYI